MGQISVQLPVVGNPVSTEDPKVRDALSDIVDEINGKLDNNNLAEAGVANINGDRLANNSVPTGKLENDAVTADKLRDDAGTDANRAVTTNHIRDDAVTADKLRDDVSTDGNRAVTTNHIRDLNVTTAKIANDAVTPLKLDLTTATDNTNTLTTVTSTAANVGSISLSLEAGTYLIFTGVRVDIADVDAAAIWLYNQTDSSDVGRKAVVRNDSSSAISEFVTIIELVTLAGTKTIGLRLGPDTANATFAQVAADSATITAVCIG